jgi:formylglycine-generating enzyme required for sulfatase activity
MERTAKITTLLATAQANDSKENGKTALAALDELLRLDSGHAEVQRLRAKITAYYGPNKDSPWTNSLGMKFVPVKGTDVLFSIWDTRVQDYQAFASATGRAWEKASFEQGPTHPAVMVSWEDAKSFCKWLTEKDRVEGRLVVGQEYRLPTDAEWSVAVGLGPETGSTPTEKDMKIKNVYPWGNQWPPPHGAGNYASSLKVDDYTNTSPVGSFGANQFGLYDIGGNVWQWCEDKKNSEMRVVRGASWGLPDISDSLLSSRRSGAPPGDRRENRGFRCVVVVGSSSSR